MNKKANLGITPNHPSNSKVQRDAEKEILDELSKGLGCTFSQGQRIELNDGSYIKPDGVGVLEDGTMIVVEAFAHIGELKSGQKRKIAQDILKLALLKKTRGKGVRVIIALCDQDAADSITGWIECAVKEFGIEIMVVNIREDLRTQLKEAQSRQRTGCAVIIQVHA